SGAVSDSYVYLGFGSIKATTGTSTNAFRFVGRLGYFYDIDLADYYLRARYYNPDVARMLSVDPLGLLAGDANCYRYVFNTSVLLTDPSGLFTVQDLLDNLKKCDFSSHIYGNASEANGQLPSIILTTSGPSGYSNCNKNPVSIEINSTSTVCQA